MVFYIFMRNISVVRHSWDFHLSTFGNDVIIKAVVGFHGGSAIATLLDSVNGISSSLTALLLGEVCGMLFSIL